MIPLTPRALAVAAWIAFAAVATTAGPAHAQSMSGAQVTFIDPSIGLAGMGRAGVAVFWDEDPEDWANPAHLGSLRGLRYSYGRTQLVPDLAEDVYFTSRRIAVGFAGVGVSVAGKPLDGIGKARLEYGRSSATDPDGNVVREFTSHEDLQSFAVGVNVLEALQGALQLLGDGAPRLNRFGDISVGHTWKEVEVDLAPEDVTLDGSAGRGEASEKDWGGLLRLVPLDQMSRPDALRLRVELGVGFSRRNYDDSPISYVDVDASDPIVEDRRTGVSARLTMAVASKRTGGIWDFVSPTVALGLTWEESEYYDGETRFPGDVTRTGQELALADDLWLRHGYVDDPLGTVTDDTWGIGVGFSYRGVLGARYDWAEVPRSIYLERIDRSGFTIFFDPYRLWRLSRPPAGDAE